MVSMVLIGLSNLVCMITLTAIILIYKLAPVPTLRGIGNASFDAYSDEVVQNLRIAKWSN
jgi:hypothetical protein